MLQFCIIASQSGVLRFSKWYAPENHDAKIAAQAEAFSLVRRRTSNQSNFVPFQDKFTLVYRQYDHLYFIFCIDEFDNELAWLEAAHRFVEVLDVYFARVKEAHFQYYFYHVYSLFEEAFVGGELYEMDIGGAIGRARALDAVSNQSSF